VQRGEIKLDQVVPKVQFRLVAIPPEPRAQSHYLGRRWLANSQEATSAARLAG